MAKKSLFTRIGSVLQNTEMFKRPSKKILGEWSLYEYFVEDKVQLTHLKSADLEANKEAFTIQFAEEKFELQVHVPVSLLQNIKNGKWSVAKNFVTFINDDNFRDNVAFQFAFEKGNLKLLKKDATGKIEFFGFFKRVEVKK